MLTDRELSAAIGSTAYGPDGDKIGTVEHFFVDDRTGAPTWVAVTTGLFGTRHSIVPAVDASFADGNLRLPVTREAVRSAPSIGDPQHLDPGDEAVLRDHYGLTAAGGEPVQGGPGGEGPAQGVGGGDPTAGRPARDAVPGEAGTREHAVTRVSGADDATRAITADDVAPWGAAGTTTAGQGAAGTTTAGGAATTGGAEAGMTRSEERLRTATETVAATRVRVVRYVVTEEVQVTVPLRREEIRVEEVPLDAPDPGPGEYLVDEGGRHATPGGPTAAAPSGGGGAASGRLPEEMVLHREEPVVSVRVVPFERVRLGTEVVAGQEQVSARLQREQIAVDQEQFGTTDATTPRPSPEDRGSPR